MIGKIFPMLRDLPDSPPKGMSFVVPHCCDSIASDKIEHLIEVSSWVLSLIYLTDSIGIADGNLVWSDTNNIAVVFLVERFIGSRYAAKTGLICIPKSSDCCNIWPGKFTQGREKETANGGEQDRAEKKRSVGCQ